MLFETTSTSDPLVIVPPKPDLYACGEYSYDNLYNYNDSTIAVTDKPLGSSGVESSTSSLTTKSSTVSFDSSAFERQLSISVSNSSIPQQQPTLRENNKITRDPKNGAFTFQVHAEYDLLLHVQKSLDRTRSRNNNADQINNIRLSQIIMRSVDDYCLKKQWMYHIGREKGIAIGRFLEDSLKRGDWANKKFTCVDLGTYCGYSALVLAQTLCRFLEDQKQKGNTFEFHIYTTEVSTKLINVANSVFRLAKMETYITPIFMKSEDSLSQTLQENGVTDQIDFLLLDHDKPRYLSDIKDLEQSTYLKSGSYVSADNVVFNRLDEYRQHMRALALKGIVETRLDEMNLEYSNNLKDGIEMTVYLKDPPNSA